ncbi:MAG: helix-turn-helix domain-containing protein [Catenulispora sp.]
MSQLGGREARTVEFKEAIAKTVARAVAAMANSYGGLFLVGVSDKGQIVGVDNKSADAMSNHCWDKLEPPWVPEIVSVPLDDGTGKFVLVARIRPERIRRRPLLVEASAWATCRRGVQGAAWLGSPAQFVVAKGRNRPRKPQARRHTEPDGRRCDRVLAST